MPEHDQLSCQHYMVRGHVQGVFYRASAADQARALNLAGWVRNLPDGRVEATACGTPQALASFADWLRDGPPAAQVTEVLVQDIEPQAHLPRPFEIRH